MNKRMKLSGFSIVEMMLLLVIVSLMLASGVTVITKKHVKVPKMAAHGAYICYRDNNGRLHEEKYLGIGLSNKVLDNIEGVTEGFTQCIFVPPARASYFHIQATGGGGGGGASGYEGGNLLTYESKTEVISPFGITSNMLTLKGIALEELQDYGGKIWAYARGDGEYGDGGKGGDVYYIKEDCANGACIVFREWEYTGSSERECDCTSGYVYSEVETYNYRYECSQTCRSETECANNDFAYCYSSGYVYEYKDKAVGYCEAAPTDYTSRSGYTSRSCSSVSSCETMQACPSGTFYCYNKNSDGECTSGRIYYYTSYSKRLEDRCSYGYYYTTCDDRTCTNEHKVPVGASCYESGLSTLSVQTTDYKAENTNANVAYRVQTKDPTLTDDGSDIAERQVLRDTGTSKTVCNYGNTTLYSSVTDGIFGSFASGEVNGVDCDTKALREAFGEQMMRLSTGQTSEHNTVRGGVSQFYNVSLGDKVERFPYYLLTEKKGIDAFGESCTNTYDGADKCPGASISTDNNANNHYTNPVTGSPHKAQKSLPTRCTITGSQSSGGSSRTSTQIASGTRYYSTQEGTQGCAGKDIVTSSRDTDTKRYYITTSCSCNRTNSSGSECLYNFDQISDENKTCMYIPEVASGGSKGTGRFCALNNVDAGLDISYVGNSNIIAGINGSDYLCTGAGYKPLYRKAEWERQPQCYAENGTESQGSARISLGGNWCALHETAVPGKGQGAKKVGTGPTTAENGQDAPYDGSGNAAARGSLDGVGYTENTARACGDNHVGYCLQASGTDGNIRENGKYNYKYTWNTNYLQYGEGAKAGEYRVKIIRSFKNRNIEITLGTGGAAGTGAANCDGSDGGDTIVGNILTAKGGKGGKGCIPTVTEQLPYWYEGGDFTAVQPGTQGELANVTNYKSNIINLVLPVDNTVLGQWIAASGAGGNGGGSHNYCWASEWERWFEGNQLELATGGKLDAEQLRTQGCRQGTYWDDTPAATKGASGAVLIKW